MSQNDSHALVIGSSIAGLLAGRVLSDHFDRVTIVDRDRLPERPELRPGTPQARHLHVLKVRGQQILERLFPGLTTDLAAAGAPVIDWIADYQNTQLNQAFRFCSDLITYGCSLSLLEWSIRRRLLASTKIRVLDQCEVTRLLADAGNSRVSGVAIRSRQQRTLVGENKEETPLFADLVVDASGRQSPTPQWLEMLGYMRPQETVIRSDRGYSSRFYKQPAGFQSDWRVLRVNATEQGARTGTIFPVEDERWVVTLWGKAGDYPPTDETGFLDFAASLPSPWPYEAIRDAQPLTPISGWRHTENRLRHFERLPRWPERFVVIGEAVCALAPTSMMGMTASAFAALTLDQCLREQRRYPDQGSLDGLAHGFQQKLAETNAGPWLMAKADAATPGTEDTQPKLSQWIKWYRDEVVQTASENPRVYKVVLEVDHMLKSPMALLHPAIITPVLGHAIRNWSSK